MWDTLMDTNSNNTYVQVDEGWWAGEFGGKRGMFPANFVEIMD